MKGENPIPHMWPRIIPKKSGKENHLAVLPYGCDGYMSTFIDFKPDIAHSYWGAIGAMNWNLARAIITDVEMPSMDFIGALRGGFDEGVHGRLELFGLVGRWCRRPYRSLSDAEMEQLKGFFGFKGLLLAAFQRSAITSTSTSHSGRIRAAT